MFGILAFHIACIYGVEVQNREGKGSLMHFATMVNDYDQVPTVEEMDAELGDHEELGDEDEEGEEAMGEEGDLSPEALAESKSSFRTGSSKGITSYGEKNHRRRRIATGRRRREITSFAARRRRVADDTRRRRSDLITEDTKGRRRRSLDAYVPGHTNQNEEGKSIRGSTGGFRDDDWYELTNMRPYNDAFRNTTMFDMYNEFKPDPSVHTWHERPEQIAAAAVCIIIFFFVLTKLTNPELHSEAAHEIYMVKENKIKQAMLGTVVKDFPSDPVLKQAPGGLVDIKPPGETGRRIYPAIDVLGSEPNAYAANLKELPIVDKAGLATRANHEIENQLMRVGLAPQSAATLMPRKPPADPQDAFEIDDDSSNQSAENTGIDVDQTAAEESVPLPISEADRTAGTESETKLKATMESLGLGGPPQGPVTESSSESDAS